MSNKLPLAFKPVPEPLLYGFSVYRDAVDEGPLHEAYDYLQQRFGSEITPMEEAIPLELVSAYETGTALIRAGARAIGTKAVMRVMHNVVEQFPGELRTNIISEVRQFSVTKNAVSGGRRLVTLRMASDERHSQHRNIITQLIDQQIDPYGKDPFPWSHHRALLPIAYLGNKSLADDIRKIRKKYPIAVPLHPAKPRRLATIQSNHRMNGPL